MTGQELYIYILNSNLINFLIMVSILVWIYKKYNLGKFFDSITNDIKNNVTSSAQAVQNALIEYKNTRKDAKSTDEKKAAIIENAQNIVQSLKETSQKEITEKKELLERNYIKFQETYKARKINKTANEIQKAVYTISLDVIHETMNEEIQKKLIDNALDEFDRIERVLK